jgi:Pyruvate/2-oxoacid:ferredoxin oxidoreductase delta subunit
MNATAPATPQLTIHAQRCAHQRVAAAHCDACVGVCPRHAWQLHEDGLAFDSAACDGCGLCVAACPHEALEIPAPIPIISSDGERELWMACEQAGIPMTDASPSPAGLTPCLHALTPDWILQWCRRHQITQVRLARGDCKACSRQPAETLQDRWQPVADRLAGSTRQVPQLSAISAGQWQARARRSDQPDPRRRRFLGQLLQGPKPQAADHPQPATLAPLTSGRRQLVRSLATPGLDGKIAAPLWQVRLETGRCTWCMACVTLCPEQVFTQAINAEGAVNHVILQDSRCTGCGLCLDVCDVHALSIVGPDQPHPRQPQTFDLSRAICPLCSVPYYRHRKSSPGLPENAAADPCPTCRRGRPARQDRLVQQTPAAGDDRT